MMPSLMKLTLSFMPYIPAHKIPETILTAETQSNQLRDPRSIFVQELQPMDYWRAGRGLQMELAADVRGGNDIGPARFEHRDLAVL